MPSVGVEPASRYVGHGYDDKILASQIWLLPKDCNTQGGGAYIYKEMKVQLCVMCEKKP